HRDGLVAHEEEIALRAQGLDARDQRRHPVHVPAPGIAARGFARDDDGAGGHRPDASDRLAEHARQPAVVDEAPLGGALGEVRAPPPETTAAPSGLSPRPRRRAANGPPAAPPPGRPADAAGPTRRPAAPRRPRPRASPRPPRRAPPGRSRPPGP